MSRNSKARNRSVDDLGKYPPLKPVVENTLIKFFNERINRIIENTCKRMISKNRPCGLIGKAFG